MNLYANSRKVTLYKKLQTSAVENRDISCNLGCTNFCTVTFYKLPNISQLQISREIDGLKLIYTMQYLFPVPRKLRPRYISIVEQK